MGLGYGAGSATFRKVAKIMGGVDMDAAEAERIVYTYRDAHKEIAQGWRTSHNMLGWMTVDAARTDNVIDPWGMCRPVPGGIKTPVGMIRYPELRQEVGENGKSEWWYGQGRNKARIYAGKIVENCIAEGTLVLTDSGWKPIERVTASDQVHDGDNFVRHAGMICKSIQPCVTVDGVYMTPDHEVLTDEGWEKAARSPRPYRPSIRGADRAIFDTPRRQPESYPVYDILNAGPQHRFVVLGEGGPFIVHNCVQHLARGIIAGNALTFAATDYGKKYPLALTVHDELVYVVKEDDAEGALATLQGIMRTPPDWWPELVVWSEGDVADNYGEAK